MCELGSPQSTSCVRKYFLRKWISALPGVSGRIEFLRSAPYPWIVWRAAFTVKCPGFRLSLREQSGVVTKKYHKALQYYALLSRDCHRECASNYIFLYLKHMWIFLHLDEYMNHRENRSPYDIIPPLFTFVKRLKSWHWTMSWFVEFQMTTKKRSLPNIISLRMFNALLQATWKCIVAVFMSSPELLHNECIGWKPSWLSAFPQRAHRMEQSVVHCHVLPRW